MIKFFAKKSAQAYLNEEQPAVSAASSACGASDDGQGQEQPKPSACGSACGAGDDK